MQHRALPAAYDVLAPDRSEIRLLCSLSGGSMVHCTLQAGQTSLAVRHQTVEELWYFLSGRGEVWRKHGEHEEIVATAPGLSLDIPLGAHFQFRALSSEPLTFLIVTMPPWPGDHEAVRVPDHWPVQLDRPLNRRSSR